MGSPSVKTATVPERKPEEVEKSTPQRREWEQPEKKEPRPIKVMGSIPY